MGCPSLYAWAVIAAAYTTVQSFCFLALNILLILIRADVYKPSTGFFGKISPYLITDYPNNCTGPEGEVSPEVVVGYQYTFLVFHVLWIIAGLVILSQLCRKTRSLWNYVMWMAVAVILLLLDTITGIFFIIDSAGMESSAGMASEEDEDCKKAAFCMILLSFRWFILFVLNIACVVVVALAMRRHKAEARGPPVNNYMDPPPAGQRLQSNSQEHGPLGARTRKPPAPLPTETIEDNIFGKPEQIESEVPDQLGPGYQEDPIDNNPQTSFQTHSPTQGAQEDHLPPTTYNWQEMSVEQYRYPMSDPLPQTSDEHNHLTPRRLSDNTNDNKMPHEEHYPFSYTAAGRHGQDPRRSMEQDERFGVHSERQGNFVRSQFDDDQRHMPPPQSRHAYDNLAWTSDAPYKNENFSHEAPNPQGGHRPPPRTKRNASNRRKRAAPQPKETHTEESIEEEEEEEEEKQTPKPSKATSLAPTASFDPRPFSYLNPTFRPTDHADVKAMKSHTADIVKTLDQEMKQLKEKDMLSEGSETDAMGIISSPSVRNYLNDSGRRQNVKRSTSLKEQLARSGKAAARQQSFNKLSPNRPNDQRNLASIQESNSSDPVTETRPQRRHTGDSARPGRTADDRDEQKRPSGDDTRRPRGGDRDRGAQRRPHNDKEQDNRHARRNQTDDANKDDYESSDYDDEETSAAQSASASRHREPVFITAV